MSRYTKRTALRSQPQQWQGYLKSISWAAWWLHVRSNALYVEVQLVHVGVLLTTKADNMKVDSACATETWYLNPKNLNPKPWTIDPKPYTLNPEP